MRNHLQQMTLVNGGVGRSTWHIVRRDIGGVSRAKPAGPLPNCASKPKDACATAALTRACRSRQWNLSVTSARRRQIRLVQKVVARANNAKVVGHGRPRQRPA